MNRVLFKQMFQADAIDFCQLDAARLASVNEILAVYLMAKKFDVPVCPHAGGVGLCELVQHLSIFDFVAVSGTLENRVTEFVDHLHEHFTDPCVVKGGNYLLPSRPGYSAQMRESSVAAHSYPARLRLVGGDALLMLDGLLDREQVRGHLDPRGVGVPVVAAPPGWPGAPPGSVGWRRARGSRARGASGTSG